MGQPSAYAVIVKFAFNYQGKTYKVLPLHWKYVAEAIMEISLFYSSQEDSGNPKYIYNIKARLFPSKQQDSVLHGIPQCEALLGQLWKEDCKIWSIVMLTEHYVSVNTDSRMLDDINRFCVNAAAVYW